MTIGTLTLASVCPGGDHITVRIQVPDIAYDDVTGVLSVSDLAEAITRDEVLAIAKSVLRVHMLTRTREEFVADLQAGIEMVI